MLSCFSRVQLFVTPWTVARQAPLTIAILQARILGGLPFPSPTSQMETPACLCVFYKLGMLFTFSVVGGKIL